MEDNIIQKDDNVQRYEKPTITAYSVAQIRAAIGPAVGNSPRGGSDDLFDD